MFAQDLVNKANDENSAAQLYIDGASGLSLNTIINTKQEDLEERIFEINTDDHRDEEASQDMETSSLKQYLKIKVSSIQKVKGYKLI